MQTNCPTIIIKEFNIDMLIDTLQPTTLQNNINKCKLVFFLSKSTTLNNTQIDHIWTNAPTQQCHVGSMKTYYAKNTPIYIAFKLFDFVLQFILP